MIAKGKINKFWFVFTLYFVLTSIGIPLHEHYCKGSLQNIQFFSKSEHCHSIVLSHKLHSDCCGTKCNTLNENKACCQKEAGKCCTNKIEIKKLLVQATIEKNKISNSKFLIDLSHFVFKHIIYNTSERYYYKTQLYFPLFKQIKLKGREIINLNQQFIC
jgi:hypothetical protein